MTRWLVTGAGGMLGLELLDRLDDQGCGFTHAELDITDDSAVLDAVAGFDVVVNAAAWTDVDGAESAEDRAHEVNAIGARNVSQACRRHRAAMIQLSTDYVFSGDATSPYGEDAVIAPKNAYGRTKAAGEALVRADPPDRLWIVRTAWLYGRYGESFLSKLLALEAQRLTLDVVDDQQGQPTWTKDLAEQIVRLERARPPSGVFHGTASGATTWYGFAQEVFRLIGAEPSRVRPVSSERFTRPAKRPPYSVLAHGQWKRNGIAEMRPWQDALAIALKSGVG